MLNTLLEMFPQAISAPSTPLNSEKPFLTIFIMSLTPGGSPPVILFHLGLCGVVFLAMSPAWARGCLACQQGRIHRHKCLAIPIPQRCFSHLHVDLVGPLQSINNFIYTFTIIYNINGWKLFLFQKHLQQHAQKL